MTRYIGAALIAMTAMACGSSSPSAPSSAVRYFRLTGTVRAAGTGAPVPTATVKVLDGPSGPQSIGTDNAGKYTFAALPQAGFNMQVSAPGYAPQTIGVNLGADTVQDFVLTRVPTAILQGVPAEIEGRQTGNGVFTFSATGINVGDGCASSIAGNTTLRDGNGTPMATVAWTLPASTLVRPAEQFTYVFNVAPEIALSAIGYSTAFTFVTVACP